MKRPLFTLALSIVLHGGAVLVGLVVLASDAVRPPLFVNLVSDEHAGPPDTTDHVRPPARPGRPAAAAPRGARPRSASPSPPAPPSHPVSTPALEAPAPASRSVPPPALQPPAPPALPPSAVGGPSVEPAEVPLPVPGSVSESRDVASNLPGDTGHAESRGDDDSLGSGRGVDTPPGRGAGGDTGPELAATSAPTGEGTAASGYGAYLAGLRERIQAALHYPPAARRRGLSGTVQLELTIRPDGAIDTVALFRSSSHAVLDEAALEAVRALDRRPLPPHAGDRSLRVRLPVVFALY